MNLYPIFCVLKTEKENDKQSDLIHDQRKYESNESKRKKNTANLTNETNKTPQHLIRIKKISLQRPRIKNTTKK